MNATNVFILVFLIEIQRDFFWKKVIDISVVLKSKSA